MHTVYEQVLRCFVRKPPEVFVLFQSSFHWPWPNQGF